MNRDQIAAEAYDKLFPNPHLERIRQDGIAIIKSAIEKATKAPTGRTWQEEYEELDTLYRELCKDYYKAKAAVQSRAAHASEQVALERLSQALTGGNALKPSCRRSER